MSKPSDFVRTDVHVSHALVTTCTRSESTNGEDVKRRIQGIMSAIYTAKLEFLGMVQDLADEAIGLAMVEKVAGFPSDEEVIQSDAYKIIRQGVDQANNGLDGVKAGIDIAFRAFGMSRARETGVPHA